MSSRIDALEARRRSLLHKCEEQRLELAYRIAQIKPAAQLTAWTKRSAKGKVGNPLVWVAGIASLVMMFRRRRVTSSVGLVTGLIALATRASTILRVIAQLRAIYLSFVAAKEPRRRP